MAFLAGCSGDPDRQRIVGDWEIAVAGQLQGQVNPQPGQDPQPGPRATQKDDPVENPSEQPPKMRLRFFNSGSLQTQTNMGAVKSDKSGRWKLLSFDSATKIAKIECSLLGDTTEFEVLVENENTIRLVPPNMAGLTKKIKFIRQ